MTARVTVTVVQSIHEAAIREINALERRIVPAEDDVDASCGNRPGQWSPNSTRASRSGARGAVDQRPHRRAVLAMHVNFTRRVSPLSLLFTRGPGSATLQRDRNAPAIGSRTIPGISSGIRRPTTSKRRGPCLGAIDLDPASTPPANTVVQARQFYSLEDDGLAHDWHGRVWLNPPYVNALVTQFCEKLAESVPAGTVTAAIVLVNNATETRWFRTLSDLARRSVFRLGACRFWKPSR